MAWRALALPVAPHDIAGDIELAGSSRETLDAPDGHIEVLGTGTGTGTGTVTSTSFQRFFKDFREFWGLAAV